MQSTVKIVAELNKPQDSPVHQVEVIELVEIKSQLKAKGPIQILEKPIPVQKPVLAPEYKPIPTTGENLLLDEATSSSTNLNNIMGHPPTSKALISTQFGNQSH